MQIILFPLGLLLVAASGEFFKVGTTLYKAYQGDYTQAVPLLCATFGAGILFYFQRQLDPIPERGGK